MARLKELANREASGPESIRKYGRAADKALVELINEFEARAGELTGHMVGMAKFCKRKGLVTGDKPAWMRAMAVTVGLRVAAIQIRAARWAVRKLYKNYESHFGPEINSIRQWNANPSAAKKAAAAHHHAKTGKGRAA
jgi:hypothetical protein